MTSAKIDIAEFKRGWKILILAFVGVATSAAVMPLYGFGALLGSLEASFDWARSDLMATTSFFVFGSVFSSQLAGWLNRRYGLRPVALFSFVGLAAAFVLLSRIDNLGDSIWVLYGCFFLISFAGVGTLQITWTQLVNQWFEKNRGLALAIILSGSGFAGMVLPSLIVQANELWGWRGGFGVLAMLPLLLTLPLALLWLEPVPKVSLDNDDKSYQGSSKLLLTGVTFTEAIRNWRYWIINLSMTVVSAAIMVMVVNTVPILTDKGFSAAQAGQLFGAFGISLVLGRVLVGFLIDRIWAPIIAFIVIALSAGGCLALSVVDQNIFLLAIAIGLIGAGGGAEFDLAAFLIARYFGMRDYARLFGLQMGVIAGGICLAPTAVAFMYHQFGNYDAVLMVNMGLLFFGATILLLLGAYPVLPVAEDISDDTEAKPIASENLVKS